MNSKKEFIPVCEPLLAGKEKEYVNEALDSGWISSSGKYLGLFEKQFAEYCGTAHATTTSSGTTALHLGLKMLDVGPGDEVIIPNFTMVASLLAVLYCGATPVFVDVEADTLNIDPKKIEEKITPKTKALMPVHLWGHSADMKPIWEIAQKHGIKLIEDAAESHGGTYDQKKCGSLGDVACFSFFANKVITTGEGGMVTTQSEELIAKGRYYKNLCFPPGRRDYIHQDLGYNYRMTNIQAAIGLAQLERIEHYVSLRRKNAHFYNQLFSQSEGLILPVERPNVRNVYWMYGIMLDPKVIKLKRSDILQALSAEGIETRMYFQPMNKQPLLKQFGVDDRTSYPHSDFAAENGFYIPSSSGLKESQMEFVAETLKKIIHR